MKVLSWEKRTNPLFFTIFSSLGLYTFILFIHWTLPNRAIVSLLLAPRKYLAMVYSSMNKTKD